MHWINLTPHSITVLCEDGSAVIIPASGNVARVSVANVMVGRIGGIELYQQQAGAVTGLPAQADGTILIVSAMVRLALPHRKDLASPGELVRNAEGQPVGCRGLVQNGGAA